MRVRADLRWVVRHRAWTPYYLKRYWRFAVFKLRHPEVITEGFVFLGKNVEIAVRPGYGRLILGKWVHLGDATRLRAHEGTLRIGDKVVFARDVTVNCYLDIEIGASTLIADWTYICDFDHRTDDISLPIKDQGLVKSPVRIGPDCWLSTKVTVVRGADIGRGSVIGANSVARGNIPEYSIAVGVPAVVVKDRIAAYATDSKRRAYLANVARGNAEALRRLRSGGAPPSAAADGPLADGPLADAARDEGGRSTDQASDTAEASAMGEVSAWEEAPVTGRASAVEEAPGTGEAAGGRSRRAVR